MRADRDVDCPLGQCGERGAAGGRLVAAGEERDAKADARRQRRHSLVVLAGENFGRRHHRRLPARFDHLRHRQERDNGLARSDVALQQPQHALFGSEIGADVVDRLALRGRQRKGQGGFEAPRQSAFSPVRAAGNDAQARPHEQERELVGEQFVIGEPRRRGAGRVDVAGRSGRCIAPSASAKLGKLRSLKVFSLIHSGSRRQAFERALRGARDCALIEPVGQPVDRLDRGQPIELLRCHHPIRMNHLAAAVPELELAGNPAGGADRQPRPHPFMIGEEEHQLDVARIVLDQHLERRPRARVRRPAMLGHPRLDGDDRVGNRVADLGARAPVDGRLRQVEEDVDHPRALAPVEQPVEQLGVLRPDPGQGARGREQRIEEPRDASRAL